MAGFDYGFYGLKNVKTPQTAPIPGRESEMIQGKSGAFAFKASDWTVLRRCLMIGTATNAYYATKQENTTEFGRVVLACGHENAQTTADMIKYASDGNAVKNSAPILALVFLSAVDTPEAKRAVRSIFLDVVRTGTHFFEWLEYTKKMRGMGRLVRDLGRSWFAQPVDKLEYQLLKYQQRNGWSMRDALRLFHVKPSTPQHATLFKWATGKLENLDELVLLTKIAAYELRKGKRITPLQAVKNYGLTHEMVAPLGDMTPEVWEELLLRMPMTATLRNLGSLTEIGVLNDSKTTNVDRVKDMLCDADKLRKGRIHPIDVVKALRTYESGGRLGKSSKTWSPATQVVGLLNRSLELSFHTQEPTGKTFLHAVDVSGSMSYEVGHMDMKCLDIAVIMAYASLRSEPNSKILAFETRLLEPVIDSKATFTQVLEMFRRVHGGGTDCTLPLRYAIQQNINVDVMVCWTDSESWAGRGHATEHLKEYRRKVNPNVRAVFVSLATNRITQVDPNDPLCYDIAGFDANVPKLIQLIAKGEV